MLENQLQILGFGKNEIKIYLALFELGKSKASAVIEKTKLHRNIVYQDLDSLVDRGLVAKIIVGGIAVYEANDPNFLVEEFEQKVKLAKETSDKLFSLAKEKPKNIGVYEGTEGIKRLRGRAVKNLKDGENFYVFGATDYTSHPKLVNFWKKFNKKIHKKGGAVKLLFNSQENVDEFLEQRGFFGGVNSKVLPFHTKMPMWAAFYNDVLDLTVGKKDFVTFSIKSKDAVEGFKAFFEYFWNQESLTYEGVDGIKVAYREVLQNANENDKAIMFAAKPQSEQLSKTNVNWVRDIVKKTKALKMIYYGDNEINQERMIAMNKVGAQTKCISTSQTLPISTIVVGDVVLNTVWSEKPVCFKTKNKVVADSLLNNFDLLWNQKIIIEEGFEAVHKMFYGMLDELEAGEEYCILGTSLMLGDDKLERFFDQYHTARIKKGVVVKMLAFSEYHDKMIDRLKRVGDPECKISHIRKYISSPTVPMQITVYKKKAKIVLFGDKPVVIHLNTPGVYEGFKTHFDSQWNQKTQTLSGEQGIKELCKLVLSEKKDLYFIAAGGQYIETYSLHFKEFNLLRIKKKIKIKALAIKGTVGEELSKLPHTEVKYLPKEFASPMVVWIFGDYVANVLWHEPQTIFLTHDKKTAEYYRQHYNALEKISKK